MLMFGVITFHNRLFYTVAFCFIVEIVVIAVPTSVIPSVDATVGMVHCNTVDDTTHPNLVTLKGK
jgi:hypothetical protein